MKANEVFPFIQGLFADGTLPEGRNLWGYAYNIDRYPGALRAAARHGMDEYRFKLWMMEYARRSKSTPPLMLPVVARWGENDRPERTLVHVPLYTMKDFDSLPTAAEAALMLEVGADAGQEVYMRDMRAPDVPDVRARIVVDDKEKEVQFNPLKMWRGEVKLQRGGCDLRQVRVLEWSVVGQDAEGKKAEDCEPQRQNAPTREVSYTPEQHEEKATASAGPPANWPVRAQGKPEADKASVGCMVAFLVVLAALGVLCVKGCQALMEPEPPKPAVAKPCAGKNIKRGDIVQVRYVTFLHDNEANALLQAIMPRATEADKQAWAGVMVKLIDSGKAIKVEKGTQLEVEDIHLHDTSVKDAQCTVAVKSSAKTWWIVDKALKWPPKKKKRKQGKK